jgi:predicted DNA-binding transcriptional regulator
MTKYPLGLNSEGELPRKTDDQPVLTGTSLRVYRYLYKSGKPQNIHEIQRGLGLSSPSVSQYHVRKLIEAGLIRELQSNNGAGFVVDKIVFENMIRVRRAIVPFQVAYSIFFASMLVLLLTLLRPRNFDSSLFVFGLVVTISGTLLFGFEALKSAREFG